MSDIGCFRGEASKYDKKKRRPARRRSRLFVHVFSFPPRLSESAKKPSFRDEIWSVTAAVSRARLASFKDEALPGRLLSSLAPKQDGAPKDGSKQRTTGFSAAARLSGFQQRPGPGRQPPVSFRIFHRANHCSVRTTSKINEIQMTKPIRT